jgi:peptidoglycan/LPS O-acetylase OafA/YrhL
LRTSTCAAQTGHATSDRVTELDLIRVVTASALVLFHYTFSGPQRGLVDVSFPGLDAVTRYGFLSYIFFLISGFVVLMSAWGRQPHRFAIARIVRLYPAYAAAVTLTAIVSIMLGGHRFPVSPGHYLVNLTMLGSMLDVPNVDVVYWTLWVELRFYLIVLLLTVVGTTRRRVLSALWLWLAATAVVELHVLPGSVNAAVDLLVLSGFSHYFIAGMALFLVYRFGQSAELWVIVALSLANAMFRGADLARQVGQRFAETIEPAVSVTIIVVIFAVMVLVALGVTRPLRRSWFAVAGDLTYPLYLVHAYVGYILLNQLATVFSPYSALTVIVATALALAIALRLGVERPLAPLLRRMLLKLADRRFGRPAHSPWPAHVPRQPQPHEKTIN